MSSCKIHLEQGRYTWRHNSVLKHLAEYVFSVKKDLSVYADVDRPGGERGDGPPTGKFMKPSELGQFLGAEFENRWYTECGLGLQPRFGV